MKAFLLIKLLCTLSISCCLSFYWLIFFVLVNLIIDINILLVFLTHNIFQSLHILLSPNELSNYITVMLMLIVTKLKLRPIKL